MHIRLSCDGSIFIQGQADLVKEEQVIENERSLNETTQQVIATIMPY